MQEPLLGKRVSSLSSILFIAQYAQAAEVYEKLGDKSLVSLYVDSYQWENVSKSC